MRLRPTKMITQPQEVADLFSILHDGRIDHWEGDGQRVRLRVCCDYLAQLIDPSFTYFTLELLQMQQVAFRTWPNPLNGPVEVLATMDQIFRPTLEILAAEVRENTIEVTCNQHDTACAYCGGVLSFTCLGAIVRDQGQRELTLEQLDALCQQYWNR